MSGVNKCIILGNLVRDPEIKSMNNGNKLCNMTVATSDQWKDKQTGEKKEKSEFHRVVIFNEHLVKVAENYLRKGSKVYLEGALQTRKWTDQAGVEKYSTEIVLQKFNGELQLLDSKGGGGELASHAKPEAARRQSAADLDLSDPIPFVRW